MAMVGGKLQLKLSYMSPSASGNGYCGNDAIFTFTSPNMNAKIAFNNSIPYYNAESEKRDRKGIATNLRAVAFSPFLYHPVKKSRIIAIRKKIKLEANGTLRDVLTKCGLDENFPTDIAAFRVYFE